MLEAILSSPYSIEEDGFGNFQMQIEVAFLDRLTNFLYDLTLYDNNELHTYRSVRINPNMNEWRSMTNLGGIVIPKVDSHSENQRVIKIIQSCQNLEEMTPFSFATISDPCLSAHLFGSANFKDYQIQKKKHKQSHLPINYSDNLSPIKNSNVKDQDLHSESSKNSLNHHHHERNEKNNGSSMSFKPKNKLRILHEADILQQENESKNDETHIIKKNSSPIYQETSSNHAQEIPKRNEDNAGRIVIKISRQSVGMSVTQSTDNSTHSSVAHEYTNESPNQDSNWSSPQMDEKQLRKARKKHKKEKKRKSYQNVMQNDRETEKTQHIHDVPQPTENSYQESFDYKKYRTKAPEEIIAPLIRRDANPEMNILISPLMPLDDHEIDKNMPDDQSSLADNLDNHSNHSYQSNFNTNQSSSQLTHANNSNNSDNNHCNTNNQPSSSLASLSSNSSSNPNKTNTRRHRDTESTWYNNQQSSLVIRKISENQPVISPLSHSVIGKEKVLSSSDSSDEGKLDSIKGMANNDNNANQRPSTRPSQVGNQNFKNGYNIERKEKKKASQYNTDNIKRKDRKVEDKLIPKKLDQPKNQDLIELNVKLSRIICTKELLQEFIKIICTEKDQVKPIRDKNNLVKLLTFDLDVMAPETIERLKELVHRETKKSAPPVKQQEQQKHKQHRHHQKTQHRSSLKSTINSDRGENILNKNKANKETFRSQSKRHLSKHSHPQNPSSTTENNHKPIAVKKKRHTIDVPAKFAHLDSELSSLSGSSD